MVRQLLAFSRKQSIEAKILILNAIVLESRPAPPAADERGEHRDEDTLCRMTLERFKADPGSDRAGQMNLIVMKVDDLTEAGGSH